MLILDAIGNDPRPIARTSSKHDKIDKQPTRTIRTRKHKDKSKDNLKDGPTNTYWKRDAPKISSRSSSDLAKSFVFFWEGTSPTEICHRKCLIPAAMYVYIYISMSIRDYDYICVCIHVVSICQYACIMYIYIIYTSYVISGQIIIFHEPRFPWNKGISLPKRYLLGPRSCEVAII